MTDDQHNNDPWHKNDKKEGPPDLEKLIRDFLRKFSLFRKKNITEKPNPKENVENSSFFVGLSFLGLLILAWIATGFYIVRPAERAVILRFGKYVKIETPGLHWIPKFIESKNIINVQQLQTYTYKADMLTRGASDSQANNQSKEQSIGKVSLVIQYRIADPRDYLFNDINPQESLQQATASALRQVVGNMSLDDILTKKLFIVRQQVENILKQTIALYNNGLEIADVVIQSAQVPDAVTEAFDDVNKARADEQRFINQAQSYQNSVVPLAQGQAKRLLQNADAYRQQTVLNATGNIAPFLAILPIYTQSPRVTKQRMYLDAMESVLQNSSKIFIDGDDRNLIYLPFNQLLSKNISNNKSETSLNAADISTLSQAVDNLQSDKSPPNNSSYSTRGNE